MGIDQLEIRKDEIMATIKCGRIMPESTKIRCTKCGSELIMDKGERVPPCSSCSNCAFEYKSNDTNYADMVNHFPFDKLKNFILEATNHFAKIPVAYGLNRSNKPNEITLLLVDPSKVFEVKATITRYILKKFDNPGELLFPGSFIPADDLKLISDHLKKYEIDCELVPNSIDYLKSYENFGYIKDVMVRAIPSYWDNRGLGIVDIEKYSMGSVSEQLRLKMILINTIRYANKITQDIYKSNKKENSGIVPHFKSLSTGDGYYLWSDFENLNMESGEKYEVTLNKYNLSSFLLLLFTMAKWKHLSRTIHLPRLKASFHIGEWATIPYDGLHTVRSPKDYIEDKKFQCDIVGNAPNNLSRLMNTIMPDQILMSECRYESKGKSCGINDFIDTINNDFLRQMEIEIPDMDLKENKVEKSSDKYGLFDKHQKIHEFYNLYANIVIPGKNDNEADDVIRLGLKAISPIKPIDGAFFKENN